MNYMTPFFVEDDFSWLGLRYDEQILIRASKGHQLFLIYSYQALVCNVQSAKLLVDRMPMSTSVKLISQKRLGLTIAQLQDSFTPQHCKFWFSINGVHLATH